MTRILILASLLWGCNSSPAPAKPKVQRSLVHNPLFGDTHPQNLFIDPNFSVRGAGVGTWLAQTGDTSQSAPAWGATLMSDSPAGIALPVARLADNAMSAGHYDLSVLAQVPGGPGPFHLRVWISALDPDASADASGVGISLLGSLNGSKAAQVTENADAAKVIAGRTWHLFEADLMEDRPIGGFVVLEFASSANTWLLQAPEFVPTALLPSPAPELAQRKLRLARERVMSERERALIDKYIHQPHISVPGSHPAITGRDRTEMP
jgi:hypothetical protein